MNRNGWFEAATIAREKIKNSPSAFDPGDGPEGTVYIVHSKTGLVIDAPYRSAVDCMAHGTHDIATSEQIEAYKVDLQRRTEHIIAGTRPSSRPEPLSKLADSLAGLLAERMAGKPNADR